LFLVSLPGCSQYFQSMQQWCFWPSQVDSTAHNADLRINGAWWVALTHHCYWHDREATLQLQKVNCRQHFGQSVAFCNDVVVHTSSKCISNILHPVVYLVTS
jgi:hypothetical protein